MSNDDYTEVEVTGWFSRIARSFVGILFGIILFLASFFVLFLNEGRIDFSQVANQAVEIVAAAPNPAAEGKLVSITGNLASDELLGDDLYLKPGKYIALNREVEMFAWLESKETRRKRNVGGSETKTTTYSYQKSWVNNPQDSSRFKRPSGHENPPKIIEDLTRKVSSAKIGVYHINMASINLPAINDRVQLNRENLTLPDDIELVGNNLFKGNGTLENPQVGDLRLQYFALRNGVNVTAFGKLESGDRLTPYLHKNKHRLYRAFTGSYADAIASLKTEYNLWIWIIRLVGFLMMWFGLAIALEPISTILDFIPLFGNISRGIAGTAAFIIAFVLSSITILVSMLLHNPIALIIAIIVAMGAGFTIYKFKSS